jgi:aspartyl-tRNA(Asn)/glutamyl-tRNA(Gln) amidotransferase subunit A
MSDEWAHQPALALGAAIENGRADPRDITDYFLDRIAQEDQDNTVYVRVTAARAKREAAEAATRAKTGFRRSPIDGVPLSWKELFNVADEPSTACSNLLKNNVATNDAVSIDRLTRAGAVLLGKTTMTELAFSGLGINPIFGTPKNPHDPELARAPGGSSSGAGVSVARGLAAAGLGTDTGGSVRIPAAWNGLVGHKTSWGRVPLTGTVPLSPSLDTIGPLTHTVADAATLFSLLTRASADIHNVSVRDHAVLVPDNLVFDGLDAGIAKTIERAIHQLGAAGLKIVHKTLPSLDEIQALAWGGPSILVAEAFGLWGDRVEAGQNEMFSAVASRFMMGKHGTAPDLAAGLLLRAEIQARYAEETKGFDAVLLPSVATSPPEIDPLLVDDAAYGVANSMALRNTTLGNQLGLCALTIPVGSDALGLPVGLMLQAAPGKDELLLRLGRALEMTLAT